MKLDVIQSPSDELVQSLRSRIRALNRDNWPDVRRQPLAVALHDDRGELVAGASGSSFGHWLQLDWLWVDDRLRGEGWGSRLLHEFEGQGRERGCRWCLLDTLEFQARPFYERRGYRAVWEQRDYPLSGCRSYMVKALPAAEAKADPAPQTGSR
ncbi:GNAT family N-acetyltransferase [Ferrimonas sediminicola]|uniref:GNAT family N-acetyltransferase n=1 Tax=Ferrimonas sediminicola TaxID=2569538 RepID=A0A4U1BDN9_9GAMM|nr:GNAT family N-acetyltransferase [Ferrimonas sediminicola]TKB48429.1 GNAT family N-acetyltransferase [Ferrimonas sediminicola]